MYLIQNKCLLAHKQVRSLFGGEFLSLGLLDLADPGLGLAAESGASPVPLDLFASLVEVGLDRLDKLVQGGAIGGINLEEK